MLDMTGWCGRTSTSELNTRHTGVCLLLPCLCVDVPMHYINSMLDFFFQIKCYMSLKHSFVVAVMQPHSSEPVEINLTGIRKYGLAGLRGNRSGKSN
jgi:hypothetical protein